MKPFTIYDLRFTIWLLAGACFLVPGARAADTTTTALITLTNAAGTTNGQKLLLYYNSSAATVYTWTNLTPVGLRQLAATNTKAQSATNLYRKLTNDFSGRLLITMTASNIVKLQTYVNGGLGVATPTNWGTVSLTTNAVGNTTNAVGNTTIAASNFTGSFTISGYPVSALRNDSGDWIIDKNGTIRLRAQGNGLELDSGLGVISPFGGIILNSDGIYAAGGMDNLLIATNGTAVLTNEDNQFGGASFTLGGSNITSWGQISGGGSDGGIVTNGGTGFGNTFTNAAILDARLIASTQLISAPIFQAAVASDLTVQNTNGGKLITISTATLSGAGTAGAINVLAGGVSSGTPGGVLIKAGSVAAGAAGDIELVPGISDSGGHGATRIGRNSFYSFGVKNNNYVYGPATFYDGAFVTNSLSVNTNSAGTNGAQIVGSLNVIGSYLQNGSPLLNNVISTNIVGAAGADTARAGYLGEYTNVTVTSGSAQPLVSAVSTNVTSVSLTAGDWDVTGQVDYVSGGGTVISIMSQGTSSTSHTLGAQDSYSTINLGAAATSDPGNPVPVVRYQISSPTTLYLVAKSTFSVSTLSAYGTLRARRVR